MNPRPARKRSIALAAAILLAVAIGVWAVTERSSARNTYQLHEADVFATQAKQALDAIAKGDVPGVRAHSVDHGITVVRRILHRSDTGNLPTEAPHDSDTWLNLSNLPGGRWTEEIVDLSDLSPQQQQEVLKRLRDFVTSTRQDYQGETYSLNGWDEWSRRKLGPVAQGKLCSNVRWIAYFAHTDGKWLIWKFELWGAD